MASQAVVSQKKQSRYYANNIKLLSPAKINLYLNILGKYPSGFHKIESIVERISLCDKIIVKLVKHNDIKIFCNRKDLENKDNLCVKAAKLLKTKYHIKHGFDIYLTKSIPVGAGLGGGSSNAAAVILAMNELCTLNLDQKDLYALGSLIGSDVNFFLSQSSFAIISGRGEKVNPFKGSVFSHVIIWPKVYLSTKRILKNFLRKTQQCQNF